MQTNGMLRAVALAREVRRHIHQNPELSGVEFTTSAYLQKILSERGWEIFPINGATSFLAYKTGVVPTTLGYRAELDALPVLECEGEFASKKKGVMHACGHDLHMALAVGLSLLRDESPSNEWPNLLLIFESSEEVLPGGAMAVLHSVPFKAHKPDAMFAFHCEPELPVGSIGICAGQYMASGDEIRITVNGKAAHGALPHTGVDTLLVAAHTLIALQTIASRNAPPSSPMVLSFGNVECQGRMNLIPASVRLDGTLRTHSETWRAEAKKLICRIAEHTAASFGATATVDITEGYPSLLNNEELATRARFLLAECVQGNVVSLSKRMTTDDFAYFTHAFPSLFLRLGVGPTGNLHSADFFPSEDALLYGLRCLERLAKELSTLVKK